MAGPDDKRVEVLEEELKLLKGEVKRTLVDLRAFIMREDSPLNERLDMAAAGGGESAQRIVQPRVVVEGGDSSRVEALESELRSLRNQVNAAPPPQPNMGGPFPSPFQVPDMPQVAQMPQPPQIAAFPMEANMPPPPPPPPPPAAPKPAVDAPDFMIPEPPMAEVPPPAPEPPAPARPETLPEPEWDVPGPDFQVPDFQVPEIPGPDVPTFSDFEEPPGRALDTWEDQAPAPRRSRPAPAPVRYETPIYAVATAVQDERPDLRSMAAPDGAVSIFFTDIEGSSKMTERLGDREWMALLRTHNNMVRHQVAAHMGFEVKSQGDGFMVAFSSARTALLCAIDIEKAFASYNKENRDEPIRVRIGLHAGEAIKEEDDFFGKTVIVAARISEEGMGGQILASSVVRDLTESLREFSFFNAHELEMKGLSGLHTVYEVGWQGETPVRSPEVDDEPDEVRGGKVSRGKTKPFRSETKATRVSEPEPEEAEGAEEGSWEFEALDIGDEDLVEAPAARVAGTGTDVMDVNMISNLVRWVFRGKRRMGQERLMDLLELYLRSGHCSSELTELIGYICGMAVDEREYELNPEPADEGVDLIQQLHGILAGGIAVKHTPRLK